MHRFGNLRESNHLAGFEVFEIHNGRVQLSNLFDRVAVVVSHGSENDLAQSLSWLDDDRIDRFGVARG